METAVRTYKNKRKMEKDVLAMTREGWAVSNISEHREQAGGATCGIILLALLTFGIALFLLLLARRTIYTVTYRRSTEVL